MFETATDNPLGGFLGVNNPFSNVYQGLPAEQENSLPVIGSGDILGWGTLGFGAFRAFRSKRVNTMTMALIVFGMWRLGMISNILPTNKDGSINWVIVALAAVLPPTAAALIGGAPALIISVISRTIWKRRRRYRSYFRRFRRGGWKPRNWRRSYYWRRRK